MDRPELEAALGKVSRSLDQQDGSEAEPLLSGNSEPGPSPSVIYRHQKDHVFGDRESVGHETSDLAPRRIRYDPVDALSICEKIAIMFDFAPFGTRKIRQKMAFTGAWLKDSPRRSKIGNYLPRQLQRSLDVVVGDIIPIWLKTHKTSGKTCAGDLQTKVSISCPSTVYPKQFRDFGHLLGPVRRRPGYCFHSIRVINLATTYSRGA